MTDSIRLAAVDLLADGTTFDGMSDDQIKRATVMAMTDCDSRASAAFIDGAFAVLCGSPRQAAAGRELRASKSREPAVLDAARGTAAANHQLMVDGLSEAWRAPSTVAGPATTLPTQNRPQVTDARSEGSRDEYNRNLSEAWRNGDGA